MTFVCVFVNPNGRAHVLIGVASIRRNSARRFKSSQRGRSDDRARCRLITFLTLRSFPAPNNSEKMYKSLQVSVFTTCSLYMRNRKFSFFLLSIAYYIFPAHIVSGLIIIAGGHIVARCLIPFVSNRLFINIYIYFYRPLCCCCCRGGRSAMVARRAISFVRPVTWCAAVPCVGDDGRDGRREKYRSDAHCARR